MRTYVKLPALLWELGVSFPDFCSFLQSIKDRERARITFKIRQGAEAGLPAISGTISTVALPERVGKGHRVHAAPTWAVPRTWVWPGHRLLGEGRYQHTSPFFFPWCLALPLFPSRRSRGARAPCTQSKGDP